MIQGTRLQGDSLQAAQHVYEHVEHGSMIVLIGMYHIAPAEFYEDVQREIDFFGDMGATFYIEGVRPRRKGRKTVREFLLGRALHGIYDILPILANRALVGQKTAIKYGERVVEADIDSDQILKHIKPVPMALVVAVAKASARLGLLGFDNSPEGRERIRKFLSPEKEMENQETDEAIRKFIGMPEEVILGERNRKGLEFTESGKRHEMAVLPWGAGHIPGMHDILIDRGYRHMEPLTEWRQVLHVEDLVKR